MAMIEVEKKFLLSDSEANRLLDGADACGEKTVEDDYFDTDDYRLTLSDLWFRRRDGVYELKMPLASGSGSYIATNRYHEITDIAEIRRVLELGDEPDFETALVAAGILK